METPRSEADQAVTFQVTVFSFGHPEKVLVESARTVAIILQRAYGTDGWDLTAPDGRRVELVDKPESLEPSSSVLMVEAPH